MRCIRYLTRGVKLAPHKLLLRYLKLCKVRRALALKPFLVVQRSWATPRSRPSREAAPIAGGDPGYGFVALSSVHAVSVIPLLVDEFEMLRRVVLSPRHLLDVVRRASRSFLHLAFLGAHSIFAQIFQEQA